MQFSTHTVGLYKRGKIKEKQRRLKPLIITTIGPRLLKLGTHLWGETPLDEVL